MRYFVVATMMALVLYFWMTRSEPPMALQWETGQSLAYDFEYKSQGKGKWALSSPSGAGVDLGKLESRFDIEGQLALRAQRRDPALGFQVAFTIRPRRWEAAVAGAMPITRPNALQGEFSLSSQGSIEAFSLAPADYDSHAPWVADLLSLLGTSLPANAHLKTWNANERSFQGKVEVTWTLDGMATPEGWLLRKTYPGEPVASEARLGGISTSYEGETRLHLDARKYVVSLEAQRTRKTLGARGQEASDTTSLHLAVSTTKFEEPSAPAVVVRDNLGGAEFRRRAQLGAYRRILGDRDGTQIRAALENLDGNKVAANMEVYELLKAFVALHPKELDLWRADFDALPYDDPRVSYVATALTAVGSPEAQAFLRAAIEAAQGDKQERLIPHLTFVTEPTEESEAFIRTLVEQASTERLRRTARLGLGTMAHNLRSDFPKRAQALVDTLEKNLADAQNGPEREHALRALGNAGLPSQFEAIKPFLKDPSEPVRTEAIEALRHVDLPEARQALIAAARGDGASRMAALESLRFAKPHADVLALYEELLKTGRDAKMARVVLGNLALLHPALPRSKEVLREFLRNCGITELCTYTESTLASLP